MNTWIERAQQFSIVVVLIIAWWAVIKIFDIPGYLLPSPYSVGNTLLKQAGNSEMYQTILSTLSSLLCGYLIGVSVAFVLGCLVVESKFAEALLLPAITALQSVPKIALAPFIFIWIGFGQPAVVTLAALSAYFPVLVNAIAGLRGYDRDLEGLFQTLRRSRLSILTNVKIPSALPQIFTGLEIGLTFALIGTVVMEFMVGISGIGFVIQESANSADLPLNFASIVILAIIGISLSSVIRGLRRRVMFWETQRETAGNQ